MTSSPENNSLSRGGQALVETLLVIVILTSVAFAALQLCIMSVDDLLCNEAAFAGVRSAVVSPRTNARDNSAATARCLLLSHFHPGNLMYEETRDWDDTILGKNMLDHGAHAVRKYNTNIKYRLSIAFASLIRPSLFRTNVIQHTARARMVKSPDEAYYFKAFPDAENFTGSSR